MALKTGIDADGKLTSFKFTDRDAVVSHLSISQHLLEVIATLPKNTGLLLTGPTRDTLTRALGKMQADAQRELIQHDGNERHFELENIRLRARIHELERANNAKEEAPPESASRSPSPSSAPPSPEPGKENAP